MAVDHRHHDRRRSRAGGVVFSNLGRILGVSFLVGFAVVAASDLLFPWQAHLQRDPNVALINLSIGRFRLYGTLQFAAATAIGVVLWRAIEVCLLARWLGPRPAGERRRDAVLAAVLVGLGLGFGWCVSPRIELHASWCFLLYAASFAAVALAGSRHQVAAFALVGWLGTLAEVLVLDPRIGWWTFTQPDLFGRVPAWEPMVWGWSGVVIHHLARGFTAPSALATAIAQAAAESA
jgi:hypothetical protein